MSCLIFQRFFYFFLEFILIKAFLLNLSLRGVGLHFVVPVVKTAVTLPLTLLFDDYIWIYYHSPT